MKCPKCDRTYLLERVTKRDGRQLTCDGENCDYLEAARAPESADG